MNVQGRLAFAIICLIIGATFYSSYGLHVDWYNQWCSGDMATLQLFDHELYRECQDSSFYQIGYIVSFGFMIISVIWGFLYPIINPIDEKE
mgnify:CR=1 FL=1